MRGKLPTGPEENDDDDEILGTPENNNVDEEVSVWSAILTYTGHIIDLFQNLFIKG